MRFINFFLVFSLAVGVAGCGSKSTETKVLDNGCWSAQDTVLLSFHNEDTLQQYQLHIPVTFTDDYAFNNIFLRLKVIPPQGGASLFPLEARVVDDDGVWMGSGPGNTIDFQFDFPDFFKMSLVGNYRFQLFHFMREETLCGVKSVGISLSPSK